MFRTVLFAIVCFAAMPACAASHVAASHVATSHVNDAGALKRAVWRAAPGEIITLAAGEYDVADLKVEGALTLRGDGDVVLYASRPVAKGLLNPLSGAALTVENLTFRGARSPDKNGAGIRNDGRFLSIINCRFEDNENGVLSTGDGDGVISISGSTFLRNGHGDGYSHGIYVLRAVKLDIQNSKFMATHIGHHVKSLADETIINGSVLDDGDGASSYAVDLSKAGRVQITGNKIVQSEKAENITMINYDTSRGGEARWLEITGNTIINRRRNGKFLRNDTDLKPAVFDNKVITEKGASLDYTVSRPH